MSLTFSLNKMLVSEAKSPTPIRLGSSWVKLSQGSAGDSLQFSVSDLNHGQFLVNGEAANGFTWAQLKKGQVSFLHDGTSYSPGFSIKASLGDESVSVASSAANLRFKAVNDKAVISQKDFVLAEGGDLSLRSMISLHDEEDEATGSLGKDVYTAKVTGGKIYVNGQLLDGKVLKTFTHEQLENGLVQFVHDGSEKRPNLTLTVKDSDGLSVTKKIDFSGTAFQAVNDVATVTTSRVILEEGVDVKLRNFKITDADSRAADSVITLNWNEEESEYLLRVDGQESHSFTYGQMLAGKVQLRLLDQDKSSSLDYTVDDQDGGITSGSLSVAVKNNHISKGEKPHVEAAGAFIFISNGSRVLDDSFLKVVDPMTSASGISISAVGVVNGSFQINGKTVTSFTLQELKDGLVSFLHNPNNGNGEPHFNLKFSYFGGGTDVLHGNLHLEVHQAPTILSPTLLSIHEDESIEGTVTSSDAGASPTYTLISDTKHGILSLEGNSYSYTPDENFNGFDSFVLAVTNEYGAVSSQAVSIIIKPVNDLVEGEVAISGVLMEGSLLSSDTSDLSDAEGMGSLHYQWLRDGAEIDGATFETYLLQQADIGHSLVVKISYTDGDGKAESTVSEATDVIGHDNHEAVGSVIISGKFQEGEVLQASSDITDSDGLGTIVYAWIDEARNVVGDGDSLRLTKSLVGKSLQVIAWYIDAQGTHEELSSEQTPVIIRAAGPIVPQIEDFVVNTTALNDTQGDPAICSLDGGGFVVSWNGYNPASDSFDIFARRYGADGKALDENDFVINTTALTSSQYSPTISTVAGGGFVVSWMGENPDNGNALDIFARRFNADGAAVDLDFVVNTTALDGHQYHPTICSLEGGGFVVSWMGDNPATQPPPDQTTDLVYGSWDIFARRFGADGEPLDESDFVVSTAALNDNQLLPTICSLEGGGFVVSWMVENQPPSPDYGIWARRFGADGEPLDESDFVVNTPSLIYAQSDPTICSLDGGGFVVSWMGYNPVTGSYDIFARRFGADGVPADASDFMVNTMELSEYQYEPTICSLKDGSFVVSWSVFSKATGTHDIFVRRFGSDGVALDESEFAVSRMGLNHIEQPTICSLEDGGFVVSWKGENPATGSNDIFFARFAADGSRIGYESDANVNDAASGSFTISGSFQEGAILTASVDISDRDGVGPISYTWLDTSGSVVGSGDSLLLSSDLIDKSLRVQAFYVDGQGTPEWLHSEFTPVILNRNDAPQGSLIIQGSPHQGETLLAIVGFTDLDGLGHIEYTWLDASGNIVGYGDSLLLSEELVGRTLQVQATYADGHDSPENVASAFTLAVENANDLPVGSITITGRALQGESLGVFVDFDDLDGLGPIQYAWLDASGNIVGSGEHLLLSEELVGRTLQVQASYVDIHGTEERLDSDFTPAVENDNDLPVGSITITGSAIQGQTLQASHNFTDADGLGPITYMWLDSGWNQVGDQDSLFLTEDLVGKALVVLVSYTDGHGTEEHLESDFSELVKNVNDLPVGVSIYGDAIQGQSLNASLNLSDVDDISSITFDWLDGNGNLVGTGASLLLTEPLVDQKIHVQASYTRNISTTIITDYLPEKIGEIIAVNSYLTESQTNQSIASLHGGGFVETWESWAQDGSDVGIFAQIFDASGNKINNEFQVNTYSENDQGRVSISSLVDGGFIVTWFSQMTSIGHKIQAQRYDDSGNKIGDEFTINSNYVNVLNPSIASCLDGGFLVTWQSRRLDRDGWDIFARKFDASGTPSSEDFKVNTSDFEDYEYATVTSLDEHGFVITWHSLPSPYSLSENIYAQRFDRNGLPLGTEFKINVNSSATRNDVMAGKSYISRLEDGGFIVAWQSVQTENIYARRFDSNGEAISGEFQVNTSFPNFQYSPTVNSLIDGGWVITWTVKTDQGSLGVGQRYNRNGEAVGDEFVIANYYWGNPVSTQLSNGEIILSWESRGDIFAQKMKFNSVESVEIIGVQESLSSEVVLVANVNDVATGDLLILGEIRSGAVLSLISTIDDADGLGPISYTWLDSSGKIVGSGDSLLLTETLVGKKLKVQASYVDGHETAEVISSEATEAVSAQIDVTPHRQGNEIQVNTTTAYDQSAPSIITLKGGGWIAVWESAHQDDPTQWATGIYQQLFDANGERIGTETRVNSTTLSYQYEASVCVLNDGGWVVTWTSNQDDNTSWNSGIYQQRFDKNGGAIGTETRVNSTTADYQAQSDTTSLMDGGWLVSWTSSNQDGSGRGIYQQRFAQDGEALGSENLVNSTTANNQDSTCVSGLIDGGWIVAWKSDFNEGVYQQRFDKNGLKIGGESLISSGSNSVPDIVGLSDGGWIVTWAGFDLTAPEGSPYEIFQQRYDSSGSPVGVVNMVNTDKIETQYDPSVTALPNGGWVIAWKSGEITLHNNHVYQQVFDHTGSKMGGEILVSESANQQLTPAISSAADNSWLVIWAGLNDQGTEIFAQRFISDDSQTSAQPSHEFVSLSLNIAIDLALFPADLGQGEIVLSGDINNDGHADLLIGTFGFDSHGFHEVVTAVLGGAGQDGLSLLAIGRELNAEQVLQVPLATQLSLSSGSYSGAAGSGEILSHAQHSVDLTAAIALSLLDLGSNSNLSDVTGGVLQENQDLTVDPARVQLQSFDGVGIDTDMMLGMTLHLLALV